MRATNIKVRGGALEAAWWGPGPAEAPTLVLLHEGLGSVALWREAPERLAASTGWGVFAYSRFGYGNSDSTELPRPLTYMQYEARVVLPEVLRAARIERAVLVGHSDGGSIAAIYAGSWAGPEDDGVAGGKRIIDTPLSILGLVTIAAHFVVEDLNIASIRQIRAEYETGTLRGRLARYHRDVDVAFLGWNDAWLDPRFQDFDITGLLPHIQVPVLGLQGAADPYGTALQIDILNANVRAPVTTQVIAGAQHSPHLEAKDVTLAAITSFIATLPRDFPM
jgi:pimeloyl-ACP methyl ester carboxylesterase